MERSTSPARGNRRFVPPLTRCRVPNRDKTVKLEGGRDLAKEAGKPFSRKAKTGGQSLGQPTEPARAFRRRLPIDDLEARRNVALLGEPGHRRLLVADGIDELQFYGLAAGIDAALGEAGNQCGVNIPPLVHGIDEPALLLLHHLLGERARFPVGRLERARTAFNGPLLTSSTLMPSVFRSSVTSAHWKMTPTEPVMVLP